MSILHSHHREFVPFEAPAVPDEVADLREQRRQLRLLCDEQRRELVRQDAEIARLRRELAHLQRTAQPAVPKRRWTR